MEVKSSTMSLRKNKDEDLRTKIIRDIQLHLVPVKAGEFMMGSYESTNELAKLYGSSPEYYNNERPMHKVFISNHFWVGRTEITQKQYQAIMGVNPSHFKREGENLPVENVSWEDAVEFCNKLTRREVNAGRLEPSMSFRLPTESEWEYCARGGHLSKEKSINEISKLNDISWNRNNSNERTHSVAKKKENELGVFDLMGNVYEWC
ncbi:hypothetical protein BVX99_00340, partial [bacterium F16]